MMRFAAFALVLASLWLAGCQKIVKEIDTPGPAPPYDPKGAALPADLTPTEPKRPADEPADKQDKNSATDEASKEATDEPHEEGK